MNKSSEKARVLARRRHRQRQNRERYLPPGAGKPLTKALRRRLKKIRPLPIQQVRTKTFASAVRAAQTVSAAPELRELPSAATSGCAHASPNGPGSWPLTKLRVGGRSLSAIAIKALEHERIFTAGELAQTSEQRLLSIKGIGSKRVAELRRAVANAGLDPAF